MAKQTLQVSLIALLGLYASCQPEPADVSCPPAGIAIHRAPYVDEPTGTGGAASTGASGPASTSASGPASTSASGPASTSASGAASTSAGSGGSTPCDPTPCDDGNPCTDDACNGGGCTHAPAAAGTLCDDGQACTYGDACVGTACIGTAIQCVSDICVQRTCNGTASCQETPLGDPVYETQDQGFGYSYAPGGNIVYWTPIQDTILYLLSSPAMPDKMQSADINEANTCDWCACGINCAYSFTGLTVGVASVPAPGLVPLYRWVEEPDVKHRSAITSPGPTWKQEHVFGWVCPP